MRGYCRSAFIGADAKLPPVVIDFMFGYDHQFRNPSTDSTLSGATASFQALNGAFWELRDEEVFMYVMH